MKERGRVTHHTHTHTTEGVAEEVEHLREGQTHIQKKGANGRERAREGGRGREREREGERERKKGG